MSTEFLLPDLGEGLTEAEIVQWQVAPGDRVTLNQTLAEVETAKAVVELPSPYEGIVASLHAEAGETVPVGAPLIAFDLDGAEDEPAPAAETSAGEKSAEGAATDAGGQANLVGYGAAASTGARPRRRARRAGATAAVVDTAVAEAAPHDVVAPAPVEPPMHERPRSTPPVRAYAKRLGIDIALVAAEIGDRVVTRADVDAYAERTGSAERPEAPASAPAPSSAPSATPRPAQGERETRVPIRGVRKRTAEAMVQSAFSAPHVTCFHTVDVTEMMTLVRRWRDDPHLGAHRIGPLALVAKAVCLALGATPGLNARWDDAAGEIVLQHFVDLGIAADTERGLIVPILRDADRMGLAELSDALRELAATAREGRTAPADLVGGTFSISNIGVFGVEGGTPILPPGQSGILAMGAVREQPWAHHGEIALREVMTLSLSFDHRIVDGAEGARFLRDVGELLEEPARALLYA